MTKSAFIARPRTWVPWVPALLLFASAALAQQPDSARADRARADSIRADSLRRAVPTMPTVETVAPRQERATFESQTNVGTIGITGSELTSAPRFFGEADVLRAVRLLPGVNARNDYSVGMNVRGGETDQNLVLLDGYPVYNPFHMAGLFGAFVEPMVDRVEFMTGGFGARYGERLSSVLDIRSKTEPRVGVHGRADVSLIATTLALGSGMQEGRGTWTVAARRTYIDQMANLYQKGSLPYHFRDVQAHVVRALPANWTLSITAYDNVDDLVQSTLSDTTTQYLITWGNRILGGTLARTFALDAGSGQSRVDSMKFEQRVSTSRFNVGMNLFDGALALHNRVRGDRVGGTLTAYGARHTRTIGYDLGTNDYAFDANYPAVLYPSDVVANSNRSAALYYDDLWRASERWLWQGGIRVDAIGGAGKPIVQPRLSAKYFVTRNVALTGAVGLYAQPTHSLAREDVPIRALDFWVGSSNTAPVSRAQHFILGAERWFSSSRAIRVETFFKRYTSLLEQNPYSDVNIAGDEFLALRGSSYGADIMLREFSSGPFSGWLAYSFAFSTRVDSAGRRFYPGQDRRHEMNAVGNWTRGRYTFSTRFNLATGTPYSVVLGDVRRTNYDPVNHRFYSTPSDVPQFIVGERNAQRLPMASRLDFSLTRNPRRSAGASFSPFLSVMNVYNARNVFAYLYDYTASPPERTGLRQFPVFPTIGMSIVW